MVEEKNTPEYFFESSWEVCNKVGGIYTVLSTRAYTLKQLLGDNLIFIGPDVWEKTPAKDFVEDEKLFADWKKYACENDHLKVRVGRWDVPGSPIALLVDFKPLMEQRNKIFFEAWEYFRVNSMKAYGDYDESCIFAYTTGRVIESFYKYYGLENKRVAALFNEWMLGMGALYVQRTLPKVATLFTTHATSIGRSIAGNNKALYAYMDGYNGDQMAAELNMEAKHSVEKQAAHHVDCFTTVSDITARECCQLLDKAPDIVTPNGFERNFVPQGKAYTQKRAEARKTLLQVAEKLTGTTIDKDALLISTSGRYEYKNKGIDVFVEAFNRVRTAGNLQKEVVAFITVPAWVRDARADLKKMIQEDLPAKAPLQLPFITHWLNQMEQDNVLRYLEYCGFTNAQDEKVKIIFAPCYLDGQDGIFQKEYYDLLIGMDLTVYPSYYEPWGYTPMESVAFGIPTITTNLAGFGLWAKKHLSGDKLEEGVRVVERTDFDYFEVAETIAQEILKLSLFDKAKKDATSARCLALAEKAEWGKFITHYSEAFDIAFKKAAKRNEKK